MEWPNHPAWSAGRNDSVIETEAGPRYTWVVDCGALFLPSGRLVVCDPFVFLDTRNNPYIPVPSGRFPVQVTLADVSEKLDRSHIREAYASVIFSQKPEATRRVLALARDGEERPVLQGDEFIGFSVDAGTACFVDDSVVAPCMPPSPSKWHEQVFENNDPQCWFDRMDDPNHIRAGLANIELPLAMKGENIIIIHSGWGDGVYPVVGSFDGAGEIIAAHIDFGVVP